MTPHRITRQIITAKGAALGLMLLAGSAAAETACGVPEGQPATGAPIRVGAIASITGPADFSSSPKAAAAYFACVNANGGLQGRPVELRIEDDGWTPEKAAAAAAKLVEDEQAVAMVASASFVECAANAPYYATAGIMAVGGVGIPRECYYAANIAPAGLGPRLSSVSVAAFAHEKLGAKRFVCYGTNIPNLGDWVCGGVKEWGESLGIEVEVILVNPGNVDSTSLVLQAKAFDPDAVLITLDMNSGLSLLAAAEEQDLADDMHWISAAALYDKDLPEATGSYWDGKLHVQMELAALDSTGPDNQAWLAVMDQYGDASDPRDTFSQLGYVSAKAFVAALAGLSADDLSDRAKVTEALRAMAPVPTDMLCNPFAVGPGARHNSSMDGRVAKLEGGAWVTQSDCFVTPDPKLADIRSQ